MTSGTIFIDVNFLFPGVSNAAVVLYVIQMILVICNVFNKQMYL